MKAGTTTLHDYLIQHPDIFMAHPKEPGYFSQPDVYARGDEWYLNLFRHAPESRMLGDGSTCYSRWPIYPEVPERISARNPNAKFVYVVRDPVSRAYSHFRHRMEEVAMRGGQRLTFAQAIEQDEEMLYAGRYADQISRFLDCFTLNDFFIFDFEQLKKDPKALLCKLYTFLGLHEMTEPTIESQQSNKAGDVYARNKVSGSLKSFRRLPVLKQIFDIIPGESRQTLFRATSTLVGKAGLHGRLGKQYVSSVPQSESIDIQRLVEYYREPNLAFAELTGLSIDHWQ